MPAAEESRAAVLRAQAALAEIEQRRVLDERRADELTRWAADDAANATAERVDSAAY